MSYKVAGIDYSMTCPAITVLRTKTDFDQYYITPTKKYDGYMGNRIYGFLMPEYESNEHRFDIISQWSVKILNKHKVSDVALEGYSMGSKGQVFNIGENTGVLKNRLFESKIKFMVPSPKTIKAFARNFLLKEDQRINGKLINMDKEQMIKAYNIVTNRDLHDIMGSPSSGSPLSDIADSYFLSLYALKSF